LGSHLFANSITEAVNLWDLSFQTWIQSRQMPVLIDFFGIFTHFGSMVILLTISLLVFLWLGVKKMWPEAVASYTCLLSAYLVMDALKHLTARPRPGGEVFTVAFGYSFPSGHALLSMAYYGFLACLLISRSQGKGRILPAAGLMVLILLTGFSRIYLNVHYMSDVIAGFGLGLLVLWSNWQVLGWYKNKQAGQGESC